MRTTIAILLCFGLAVSAISAQATETEMDIGAWAAGTYTLSSAGGRTTGVAIINEVRLDDDDFDLTGLYSLRLAGESMPPRRLQTISYQPATAEAWWMYPPPLLSGRMVGDSIPVEAGRYAAGVLGIVGVRQFAGGRLEFELPQEAAETFLEPVDHESISVSDRAETTAIAWDAVDGAEAYLVSVRTAEDRLYMAASADPSRVFDSFTGDIELIEIRAFTAPPAHTSASRADYPSFEGPELEGFTGGYLAIPIDPTANDIVHQSIQIVRWLGEEAVSVEEEDEDEPVSTEPTRETERPGEE